MSLWNWNFVWWKRILGSYQQYVLERSQQPYPKMGRLLKFHQRTGSEGKGCSLLIIIRKARRNECCISKRKHECLNREEKDNLHVRSSCSLYTWVDLNLQLRFFSYVWRLELRRLYSWWCGHFNGKQFFEVFTTSKISDCYYQKKGWILASTKVGRKG